MAAPALQAAGAVLGARSLLPRAIMAAALALLVLLLLIVAPLALLSSSSEPGTGSVPDGIPAAFVPIYRESAAAFGLNWLLLASVHSEETGFSTHPTTYHGLNSAGCCAGPFQFNVTNGPPSTWDGHKWAFRRGRRPGSLPAPAGAAPLGLRRLRRRHGRRLAAARQRRRRHARRPHVRRRARLQRRRPGRRGVRAPRPRPRPRLARHRGADPGRRHPPAAPGGGELSWPVRGPVVSPFGMRWGRLHAGIDIAVPAGTPILAAATGRVTTRGWVAGYGLLTCLEHTPPHSTCYAHQSRLGPTPTGGILARGALVGFVGCTGHCFGPHLHFEVRISGRPVDPLPYLRGGG